MGKAAEKVLSAKYITSQASSRRENRVKVFSASIQDVRKRIDDPPKEMRRKYKEDSRNEHKVNSQSQRWFSGRIYGIDKTEEEITKKKNKILIANIRNGKGGINQPSQTL